MLFTPLSAFYETGEILQRLGVTRIAHFRFSVWYYFSFSASSILALDLRGAFVPIFCVGGS
jgi:hypothetical protein